MANIAKIEWTRPELGNLRRELATALKSEEFIKRFESTRSAKVPLLDDITLDDAASSFKPASNLIPFLQTAEDLLAANSARTGTVTNLQRMFDLQVWEKTLPIKVTFDALFTTKTDPVNDILVPVVSLLSLTGLTAKPGARGQFFAPGVTLTNLNEFVSDNVRESANNNVSTSTAKKVALNIPGVVDIRNGILETIRPTFSKERTESGVPLWCKASLTIKSIFPFSDEDFISVIIEIAQNIKQNQSLQGRASSLLSRVL